MYKVTSSKKKRQKSKTWLGGDMLAKFVVCLAPSAILVSVTKYMKNEIYKTFKCNI
jgi:hypothetical protein